MIVAVESSLISTPVLRFGFKAQVAPDPSFVRRLSGKSTVQCS